VARARAEFDAAFAAPPAEGRRAAERLVRIEVGGERFALRLADLAGLRRLGKLVALPGARPELLGVAGLRGRLVPVFDLGRLLGCGADEPRWLALARAEEPVGLAFGGLEGQIEVAPEAQATADAASAVRAASAGAMDGTGAAEGGASPGRTRGAGFLGRVVRDGDVPLPVVEVGALVAALAAQAGPAGRAGMEGEGT
jgi:purine-binding chemotaxis protein CheW